MIHESYIELLSSVRESDQENAYAQSLPSFIRRLLPVAIARLVQSYLLLVIRVLCVMYTYIKLDWKKIIPHHLLFSESSSI